MRRALAIRSSIMGPFEISKSMVATLGDEALRNLLGRLIEAEAKLSGLPLSGIDLGGNQTAPDGGVDAAIRWSGKARKTDWLPRRWTVFQSKAQKLTAKAIKDEMRPKGQARPIFTELAAAGGAYVIFSTDDPSSSGMSSRLEAMTKALPYVPRADAIHLDFYGVDRIARWVSCHPGVAMWVREQNGRRLGGWSPSGPWSGGAAGSKYHLDDVHRVRVDGRESDITGAIVAMREALSQPGGCVRLVGVSGTGKTRLAEALFDARISGGPELATSSAIYGDAGLELDQGALLTAEQLILAKVTGVMVVDNCTAKTHAALCRSVAREGSQLSVLTIDYDIEKEQPEETLMVQLGPNSEGVLQEVLRQRAPHLSPSEVEHVASFSEGNARVALAVVRQGKPGVDLSKLNDRELLDRLFQTGRKESAVTRKVAEVASLVYAFHADEGTVPVEYGVLADICGVAPHVFYREVQTLLGWGIVQQRGPQRAVKPDPIANQLSAEFLEVSDPHALAAVFRAGPERLFASFARRLGQLGALPKVQALAAQLLSPDDSLGDLAGHSSQHRRAFQHLAPAAPLEVLRTIEQALNSPEATAAAGDDEDRRELGALLVHLAYEDQLFGRAMRALAKLVHHAGDQDSTLREYLLQRFWPALSFTHATLATRLDLLDEWLDDDAPGPRALALEALDHMLTVWHMSSSFDPSFGSQPRLTEWRPFGQNYVDWVEAALSRLETIVTANEPGVDRARGIVTGHIREHIHGALGARLTAAIDTVRPSSFWDKGWRKVSEALHFSRLDSPSTSISALEALERSLRPKTVDDCFQAFVLGPPWRHYRPRSSGDAYTRKTALLARAVGVHLARSGEPLDNFLARAVAVTDHNSVEQFGEGLARVAPLESLWQKAYGLYAEADSDVRDPAVLIGIAKQAARRNPSWTDARLSDAVTDPLLQHVLVQLHSGKALGKADIDRFILALEQGVHPTTLSALMYGGASLAIPAEDLARLLLRMLDHADGATSALGILSMRFYADRRAGQPHAPELLAVGLQLVGDARVYNADRGRSDHELAGIARPLVTADQTGAAAATSICRALRSLNRPFWRGGDYHEIARLLMTSQPRVVLDELVTERRPQSQRRHLADIFFGGFLADADDLTGRERFPLDDDVVIEWAKEVPQARSVRLAELVTYAQACEEGGELTWSSLALALVQIAPDPVAVLQAFEDRFFEGAGSGSFASRFVRRKPMVAALKGHTDRRVRNWAREALVRLDRNIEHWKNIDRVEESLFE